MYRSLFKRPLILSVSCVLLLFLLQFLTACAAQGASVQVASAQTTQGQVSTQSGNCGLLDSQDTVTVSSFWKERRAYCDTIAKIITQLQNIDSYLILQERHFTSTGCLEDKSTHPETIRCNTQLSEVYHRVYTVTKHREDEIRQLEHILELPQAWQEDFDGIINEFKRDVSNNQVTAVVISSLVAGACGVGAAAVTGGTGGLGVFASAAFCTGVVGGTALYINNLSTDDNDRITKLQQIQTDLPSQEVS